MIQNFNELAERLLSTDAAIVHATVDKIEQFIDIHNGPVSDIHQALWTVAGFKNQVYFVDAIYERMSRERYRLLMDYTVAVFHTVETDRRDKYFYLLKRGIELFSLSDILRIENSEALDYCCRFLSPQRTPGWSDELVVEYLCRCPSWVLYRFAEFKISEKLVRQHINKEMPDVNRRALYGLFK